MDTNADNAPRSCPGCGGRIEGAGRGLGKSFCAASCRQGFHNRQKAEGATIAALTKAWQATRHAKAGTREAEVCRFARQELTALAGHWNDQDEAAGRPSAVEYVAGLMESGAIWADRVRV